MRASRALFAGDKVRDDVNHHYADLWSWDIAAKKWTKERINGNPPCGRTEMAVTYVRNRHLSSFLSD